MNNDIDFYIKKIAINKIKAYVKYRCRKVFPEYEKEVDRFLMLAKIKLNQQILS
jgi:hypothetical protein